MKSRWKMPSPTPHTRTPARRDTVARHVCSLHQLIFEEDARNICFAKNVHVLFIFCLPSSANVAKDKDDRNGINSQE